MTSFAKFVAVFSAGLLTVGILSGKDGDPTTSPARAEGKKEKDKKKKEKSESNSEKTATAPKVIDIPVPKDHDAKGLKIPYFDDEGKLQMRFNIGVAKRIDETHIDLAELQIEMFDAAGEPEMAIDLPTSILDLTTSVITAQKAVKIQRADFELTGEKMIFNTKTRQGGLGGKVRMLIYNLENETAAATPAVSKVP